MKTHDVVKSHKTFEYIILTVVAGLSIIATLYFDFSESMKILSATPLVAALSAVLIQLFRDDKKFLDDLIKQDREHQFVLAATSHMSSVVFDKHVQFSEEYVQEMNEILNLITRVGRKVKDTTIVFKLGAVRIKYRLWLSKTMTEKLIEFERTINSIIGGSELIELSNEMDTAKRKKLIDETYDKLREVLDLKGEGGGNELVISHLQEILGVSELTTMRDNILFKKES